MYARTYTRTHEHTSVSQSGGGGGSLDVLSVGCRRGAVVKRVEHISTIVLVNIWVVRVRVPLVLSVGIWICQNSIINT